MSFFSSDESCVLNQRLTFQLDRTVNEMENLIIPRQLSKKIHGGT